MSSMRMSTTHNINTNGQKSRTPFVSSIDASFSTFTPLNELFSPARFLESREATFTDAYPNSIAKAAFTLEHLRKSRPCSDMPCVVR